MDPFKLCDLAVKNVLGESVVITSETAQTYEVKGVFTEEAEVIDGDAGIVTTMPMIMLVAADIPEAVKTGFIISIRTIDYTIDEIRKEGSGAINCYLKKDRS